MAPRTYQINTQGLTGADAPLLEIVLGVEYVDPTNSYSAAQWFVLAADQSTATWTFDPGMATTGTVFYQGILVSSDGVTTPIAVSAASGQTILVGAGVPPVYTVAIVPVQLDWTRMTSAAITLGTQRFVFTSEQSAVQFVALTTASYGWSAVYTLNDGSTYTTTVSTTQSPILLLPVLPPVSAVSVSVVASDFQSLPLDSISVTVESPGGAPATHTFTAENASQPFSKNVFQTSSGYSYSYIVTYSAQSEYTPFKSSSFTGVTTSSVSITEVGIRTFALDTLSPIITTVTLSYVSGGSSKTAALPVTLVANDGAYTPGDLSYTLTFDINGTAPGAAGPQRGTYVQPGPSPAPAYVRVANPLQPKTTSFTASGLPAKTTLQLNLSSFENGGLGLPGAMQWEITGARASVTLSAQKKACDYTFEAIAPTTAAVNYPGTVVTASQSYPFTNAATIDTAVSLSPSQLPFTITMDPSMIQWDSVDQVVVAVWSDSQPAAKSSFTFTPASGYQYFTYSYPATGPQSTYGYQATYHLSGGGQLEASADKQPGTTLVIPAQGTGGAPRAQARTTHRAHR